jgi:hypothetical protein
MQLLGQMNQFGFIFWMLLAMYCFLVAWDKTRWRVAAPLAAAVVFEYMSLWSYESQLLLILIFPVIVVLARREWRRPARLIAWYSVPVTYLVFAYLRYSHSGGQSYQESVLRKSWGLASIAGDWAFNIAASLEFWGWQRSGWRTPRSEAHLLSAIVAVVFAAGWVAVIRLGSDRDRPNPFAVNVRSCRNLLAAGVVTLALSFPVYLVLNSARGLWRTQILCGIGSGIVMAAVLALISWAPVGKAGRMAIVLTAGAIVTYCGSVAAIEKGGVHRWDWDRHRIAITELLQFAPRVQPETVVVFTNIPKDGDPFAADNLWLDTALRLAYPGTPVAGVYFFADGSPGPGNNLTLEGGSWHWDGKGFARMFTTAPLTRTIVMEYHVSPPGKLLQTLPSWLCKNVCDAELYHPNAAVAGGAISPIAARRFEVPHR